VSALTSRSACITLRKRADFLAVRGGTKWSSPSFLLEGKARASGLEAVAAPRFGFTVTKELGPAVARNRIRRRLKEALLTGAISDARAGFDYVVVARKAALTRPFTDLVDDFRQAFSKVHRPAGSRR
jgi:ribonuclease P protein component